MHYEPPGASRIRFCFGTREMDGENAVKSRAEVVPNLLGTRSRFRDEAHCAEEIKEQRSETFLCNSKHRRFHFCQPSDGDKSRS